MLSFSQAWTNITVSNVSEIYSEQPELTKNSADDQWQQGKLVEVTIVDLSNTGDGVGRWGVQGQVVFVPDTVPGDRVQVRLVQVKPRYAHGKLQQILSASPHRIRPSCIVADKCGGCQWQPVDYAYQLEAKRNQVIQALERIGKFNHPPADPVLAAPSPLGYRNKATYPLGYSKVEGAKVQAGYYQKGTHRLINLNQCPVQDPRLNPLLADVKQDIQRQGWPVYAEQQHQGQVRHLSLRIGRRTGEILLTLVVRGDLPGIEAQAQAWCDRYPSLVGVLLNYNPQQTNVIFGAETRCIAGRSYLWEEFAGLRFQIRPDTFFQIYTEQAEALLSVILAQLNLQGDEVIVDAYCGIGTLILPLAKRVQYAIGLEKQSTAVEQARQNAALNQIQNVTFQVGAVETLLPMLEITPDVVLLDPPRKGCDPAVIEHLNRAQPHQIVYVSCNPTTLARDLQLLCHQGNYHLIRVQPADFFPQTAHVECVAFLVRQN